MRLLPIEQLDDQALLTRDPGVVRFLYDCVGATDFNAISNVTTRMHALDTGSHLFPISINDGGERADNSYVVSPLSTYSGYAEYELSQLGHPLLVWPLKRLVSMLGKMLIKHQIDRIVQVNNWLLSTNLYPQDWDGSDLPEITHLLADNFPDHAIGFRSLNRYHNANVIDRLQSLGYIAIPSRQVYLFDARAGDKAPFLRHNNVRIDACLLQRTPYRLVPGYELDDDDYPRLQQLYNLLYLDKYCTLNPQFSSDWLRRGHADGWLELSALRSAAGRIDGVLGWFGDDRILSAPVVGYDTTLPKKNGLYRLLTQLCLKEAVNRRCVLNFSSGAAQFKRLRGGQPEIEYSMVYIGHLPISRQRIWRLLSRALHTVGVPLIKALKL